MDDSAVQRAAEVLVGAGAVCVSTGAGMSKESGFDTFRGEDGTWSKVNVEDVATPEAFRRDPLRVWAWYRSRRDQLRTMEPHAGHHVLAGWEERVERFTVVTQNIDGLHHRAGSRRVIELHGRLDSARCTYCDYSVRTLEDLGEDPACPVCQKRMRPDVVWFGEALPPGALEAEFEQAQNCDVLLVIGTSGVVQPAASLVDCAKACGAQVIEINPFPSAFGGLVDIVIRDGCRDALKAVDRAWLALGS
jgi:NAD-dependent deacetylase